MNLLNRRGQSLLDKILSIILIAAIVGAIVILGYVIVTPNAGERFTEFYILGLEGKAENYPKEVVVGDEVEVIIGIINREHETESYRLEVRIDGLRTNEVGPLVLGHDEKWEDIVSFAQYTAGNNQKVEFLLYKDGESEAYLTLHLWVNVKE